MKERRYIRTPVGWRENLAAAAAGACVAGVVFYFTRILLAREPLESPEDARGPGPREAVPALEGERR